MSTFLSIGMYAVLVLAGLILFSGAMVVLGGWLVKHTDDPDAHH